MSPAEEAAPSRRPFKEDTSSLTSPSEASNNYHTNTQTSLSTQHHLHVTPMRTVEETEAWEATRSSVYRQDLTLFSVWRAEEFTPHPPHSPCCTHIAPAFAKLILPLLLLLFLLVLPPHMHTPFLAEHSSSLPQLSAGANFFPNILFELCV